MGHGAVFPGFAWESFKKNAEQATPNEPVMSSSGFMLGSIKQKCYQQMQS
jgi:hypothetical protein